MLGDKTFREYLQIIKTPVLIYLIWSILYTLVDFVLRLLTLLEILGIDAWIFSIIAWFPTLLGMGVGLIVYLYVGWSTAKKHGGTIAAGGIAGLFAGLFTGLIAALLEAVKALTVRVIEQFLIGYPLTAYFIGAVLAILAKVVIFISLGLFLGLILGEIGAVIGGARK